MTINFGTKAETLEKLNGKLMNARVLPQFRFTVNQWKELGPALFEGSKEQWLYEPVIVRSSGVSEDTVNESLAGHFKSVGNVLGFENIFGAIETVAASYGDGLATNQIFIQPMLTDVKVSGVLFTKDINTGAPYIVINYDEDTGAVDTVTSGKGDSLKTFYHAKSMNYICPKGCLKDWKGRLISTAGQLERLFNCDSLDVEFAINKHNDLIILQVRHLVDKSEVKCDLDDHRELLSRITNKVESLSKPHPYLHGDRSVFGVMPDWNPAEIIGLHPNPMALSLYKELITDNIWAYQRSNYGYRDLRSFPLMISFCGLPYIDVRVSFNSFIPAGISDELANKLVNFYIDKLCEQPNHHDKVEFEIINSCYSLDLPERLKILKSKGFSQQECSELQDGLRTLTNNIISKNGLWKRDIEKIQVLEARRKIVVESDLNDIEKIYWLIEDCKRYGTLPFAGLARAGFIAIQMLRSLTAVGILSEEDRETFMSTLNTVSSSLAKDLSSSQKKSFLEKYGHLRPGTYDVQSPRYDEAPDTYFDWDQRKPLEGGLVTQNDFKPSLTALNKIAKLLKHHDLAHDILSFFDFIKGAIEGREYAKFIFTKSLSEVLRLVSLQGQRLGFEKSDVSYADICIISKLYSSSSCAYEVFKESIDFGKRNFVSTKLVHLPPLITSRTNICSFELPVNEANFVTLKSVTAPVVDENAGREKLKGNIIMIPSADPGYDWIFSQNIAGFITMFGGANSHMAIRAAELSVPAVIGAGEVQYKKWSAANKISMDCSNRVVRLIS